MSEMNKDNVLEIDNLTVHYVTEDETVGWHYQLSGHEFE